LEDHFLKGKNKFTKYCQYFNRKSLLFTKIAYAIYIINFEIDKRFSVNKIDVQNSRLVGNYF